MLVLLQLINRMIHLEYTEDEVRKIFDDLNNGNLDTLELFTALGLEMPIPTMRQRLNDVLPKRESAIKISFLKSESEWT